MRKDALPDPRLGWQFSAVDKLRAKLPATGRRNAGGPDLASPREVGACRRMKKPRQPRGGASQ
jgi:hypothetical protein